MKKVAMQIDWSEDVVLSRKNFWGVPKMAGRRRRGTSSERDKKLAFGALLESQTELDWFIEKYDECEHPSGRTLSLLCSRILEELRVFDGEGNLEIPSLAKESKAKDWTDYLSYTEAWYPGFLYIKFRPHEIVYLISQHPVSIGRQMPLPKWLSETIFVVTTREKSGDTTKQSQKKYSRRGVLKAIRTDLGAHFLSNIGQMYEDLAASSRARMKLAGPVGWDEEKEIIYENLPYTVLVRMISAELQVFLRNVFSGKREAQENIGFMLTKSRPLSAPQVELKIEVNKEHTERLKAELERKFPIKE